MDEEDFQWEFLSNGGCERCDAMDGRLSDENPHPRPHPGCSCQIVKRDWGLGTDDTCDEGRMRYTLLDIVAVHHPHTTNQPDEEFDLVHVFAITCPDGETIEADISVSVRYGYEDVDELFEDAFAEALELVEELAASECQTCPAPPEIV